jgi:hypothetical protein
MMGPRRIGAAEVRGKLASGSGTLLVCAYPDDAKFKDAALDGAISFRDFERRKASLPRDAEIVFY